MKVLVVEDEIRLAEAISQIVVQEGLETNTVHNGDDAVDHAQTGEYDLMILDVMLPKKSGFEIVRELRNEGNDIPVLMLTAKSEIDDKVEGLDRGADDYMTKPFDSKELLARVRALIRRHENALNDTLVFSDLTLDLSNRELSSETKSIHLGFKEFEILRVLMQNPNQITSKENLIIKVWGIESEAEDNNVEAFISFLRKKIFHLGSGVGIKTVRKVGYQLQEPEENIHIR